MPSGSWDSSKRAEEGDDDYSRTPLDDTSDSSTAETNSSAADGPRGVRSSGRGSWICLLRAAGPSTTLSSRSLWSAPILLLAATAIIASFSRAPVFVAGGNVTTLSVRRTYRSRISTAFLPARHFGTRGGSHAIGFCVVNGGRLLVRRRPPRDGGAASSADHGGGDMPPFRHHPPRPRVEVAGVDVGVDGRGFALRGCSRAVHNGDEVVDAVGDGVVHHGHAEDGSGRSAEREEVFFPYAIGSVDLSDRWVQLVREGHVRAELALPGGDVAGGSSGISYGVRVKTSSGEDSRESLSSFPFEEYVEVNVADEDDGGGAADGSDEGAEAEDADDEAEETQRRRREMLSAASRINATLSSASRLDEDGIGVLWRRCRGDPGYAAQVQLVRTLRPSASAGMRNENSDETKISAAPPPYDPAADSFVTGPLRLWGLRPLAAKLTAPASNNGGGRIWDVYHNVSPADVRGHFLLVPDLDDPTKSTWRGQRLLRSDCVDLVALASTIDPPGSLCVGFNSVGGGASQNHVHAHLWPCPPLPLMGTDGGTTTSGWECYPASRAPPVGEEAPALVLREATDEGEGGGGGGRLVRVELLDYPCCVVRLTASTSSFSPASGAPSATEELGVAVSSVLDAIGDRPHNVCILNRPSSSSSFSSSSSSSVTEAGGDLVDVVVHVFVRSRDGSPNALNSLTLGSSEVMGLFHCQSEGEMAEAVAVPYIPPVPPHPDDDEEEVAARGFDYRGDRDCHGGGGSPSTSYDCSAIEVALRDVSAPHREVWDAVRTELLFSNHDDGNIDGEGGPVWTEEQ